jgi:hypothetical protein
MDRNRREFLAAVHAGVVCALTVELLFLDTFMGGLAEEFFPWLA